MRGVLDLPFTPILPLCYSMSCFFLPSIISITDENIGLCMLLRVLHRLCSDVFRLFFVCLPWHIALPSQHYIDDVTYTLRQCGVFSSFVLGAFYHCIYS